MMGNYALSIKFFAFIHIVLIMDDYIQSIKFLYLSFLMMDGYIQSIKFFPFIFLMIWMSTSSRCVLDLPGH